MDKLISIYTVVIETLIRSKWAYNNSRELLPLGRVDGYFDAS